LDWYRWIVKDYRASRKVGRMNTLERGVYRELLDECWIKGSIPDKLDDIAEILDEKPDVIADAWERVRKCFDASPEIEGHLINLKLEEQRTEKDRIRISKQAGGKARQELLRVVLPPFGEMLGDASTPEQLPASPEQMLTDAQCETAYAGHGEANAIREEKRREEKEKSSTPLPPKGGSGRRPRKTSVDAFMESDIPREIIDTALRLYSKWDTTDPDGREIRADFPLMVTRMSDIIAKHGPQLTIEILERGAMDYLAYKARRRKAPQYYFGMQPPEGADKPLWRSYAEAAYMKQKITPTPPAPPTQEPMPLEETSNG
jgi:hypothetical protein